MDKNLSMFKKIAVCAIILSSLSSIGGCSRLFANDKPGDPEGAWMSTDHNSYIQLNSNGTGEFTLCRPDVDDDGLRYDFSATSWPSTIQITWRSVDEQESGNKSQRSRVYLYQDWEERQKTQTGFNAIDRIFLWREGNLEMGTDLVVVYKKVKPGALSCTE